MDFWYLTIVLFDNQYFNQCSPTYLPFAKIIHRDTLCAKNDEEEI